MRSCEYGLYEACDLLLGDHLCEKSECVKWVDTAFPHKRKRRVKDNNQLQLLQETDPNSTDIFDNLIDTFYPDRPQDMEEVCLYDLVKQYEKKVADNGEVKYRKTIQYKTIVPNHKIFDPNKEHQREDYYYSFLLLFVPFREEEDLLQAGETAKKAISHVTGPRMSITIGYSRFFRPSH